MILLYKDKISLGGDNISTQLLNKIKKIATIIIPIWIVILSFIFIHQQLSINTYLNDHKSSTYLKSLTIENHRIKFDPKDDYYEIALNNNETSLSIIAEPEDKSATVKIFNNDDLTNHDAIYIYVTSKDHNIRKYTIGYNNKMAIRYFNNNIDDCTRIESDYCLKFFNTKDNNYDNFLLFSYDYLTADGYPKTNIISINDKTVFNKNLINGEFRDFHIIDDKIVFTYFNKQEKNKIYLFGADVDGKVILNKTIINNTYKDLYTYDVDISSKRIKVKTRLTNLTKEAICKLNNNSILEARYTINYQNNVFKEPILDNRLTVLGYKIIMNIKC